MTLVKWNPRALDREINSLVKTFWGAPSFPAGRGGWNPRVDVAEHDDRYEGQAELPGRTKDDVTVTLKDGVLTLEGEKKQATDSSEDGYRRSERVYGKFSRSFNLGDRVAAEKISAAYKDGVLTVALPKAEEVKPKAIEVEIA